MGSVYPRGKKYYIDFYDNNGKRVRKAISTKKKVAELALKEVEVKKAKREPLDPYNRSKILFENMANEYILSSAHKAASSIKRDKVNIKNLRKMFGGKYLHQIDLKAIDEYKNYRKGEVSNASINRELACIRHMLNIAVQRGYLTVNPIKGVKLLKEPPPRVDFLEKEQISQMLRLAPNYLKDIIIIGINTGLRPYSELLKLEWGDVDFKNGIINIRNSKTNTSRAIPMNKQVRTVLEKRHKQGNSEMVFTYRGKPFKNFRDSFKNVAKKAKIRLATNRIPTPYIMRHTFASHMAMTGCSLYALQQLLGHKSITTTMKYAHLSQEYISNSVQKLDDIFNNLVTNVVTNSPK